MRRIDALRKEWEAALGSVSDSGGLEALRIRFLGRKQGQITALMNAIKDLPQKERREFGRRANALRQDAEASMDALTERLRKSEAAETEAPSCDLTLPGRVPWRGTLHPLTGVREELESIFMTMGFSVAEGPEIETDYYNFEALNMPQDHPAREMQDTFFTDDGLLLRTHTSPVQIHTMLAQKPPIRVIAPGKVYRRDYDVRHTPMFVQIEGLAVGEGVTFSHLKGTLEYFARRFFGDKTKLRFRPSFFPFTEPSAEVDVECRLCKGAGCRLCGEAGWIEILGAGMVDPNVFLNVNIDPERFTGFAFGLGVDRMAVLKYGIDDSRQFYENDLRFLEQFPNSRCG